MPTRKTYCLPSLVTTFIALALLVLVTISVPLTTQNSSPFYIVEATGLNGTVRDATGNGANPERNLTAIRAGLWGYCSKGVDATGYGYCSDTNHEYNITLVSSAESSDYGSVKIGKSWTRGLVVVIVALVSTAVGFLLSFFPHLIVQLIAALVLFFSLILTLIAFAIQIAYYIYFRTRIHDVTDSSSVTPGAGFYMTLACLPLLAFSMLTVFCGWRTDKSGDLPATSYTGNGAYGAYGSGTQGGMRGRFAAPWKRSRGATATTTGAPPATSTTVGGSGQEEYEDGHNKDSIPLSSRQRVLDAFHKS